MFSFNLVISPDKKPEKLPINKTCSPALEWAPREITCETNYMEVTKLTVGAGTLVSVYLAQRSHVFLLKVSVVNNKACPTGTTEDDWDATTKMVMCDCLTRVSAF